MAEERSELLEMYSAICFLESRSAGRMAKAMGFFAGDDATINFGSFRGWNRATRILNMPIPPELFKQIPREEQLQWGNALSGIRTIADAEGTELVRLLREGGY